MIRSVNKNNHLDIEYYFILDDQLENYLFSLDKLSIILFYLKQGLVLHQLRITNPSHFTKYPKK